ncbi:hypothetical protein PoB_004127300 [Plakobranchus ocellatus]|uniref:Uncharacterized protein n=1 Tax=Plakobranchus ocellatus TaxID=259542 RepID=A0AAV4B5A0_9GAST|nr:hypothetical protein PoB_004127300 [Plakobranchus ocellatus]
MSGKPMTFAEAYRLRKKMEETEEKLRQDLKGERPTTVSNIADMNRVLRKIVQDLADEARSVVKYTKRTLKEMPPHFVKHVTTWQDEDDLDLLHHLIINNKPELLAFIFGETSYFPAGYMPPCNPYAHLAAILGHTDCLKVILQSRPSDYFKSDKPSHAIKLPDAIMRKNKLNETPKKMPKKVEKMLEKIKRSTENVESTMQWVTDIDSDITTVLDKDLGAIEKSFVKGKKHLPKSSIAKDRLRLEKPKTKDKSVDDKSHSLAFVSSKGTFSRGLKLSKILKGETESEDTFEDHFRRRIRPEFEKHRLTVYWDAFSESDDTIKGIKGEPIKVVYSPKARYPRSIIDLDRTNCQAGLKPNVDTAGISRSISKIKRDPSLLSSDKSSSQSRKLNKTFEAGVRSIKKYKDFHLKENIHPVVENGPSLFMNKTPLTYAAERNHFNCIQLIFEQVILKRYPLMNNQDALTLATKARSPETIMLLMDQKISKTDYQSAVMLSIREMYPDCMTALIIPKGRERDTLFEGTNLYHILYSQSVVSNRRYELMPEMTRALISAREDVNAHDKPLTYPIYTLINCSFNITVGKQIFYFIECLNLLLEAHANPHFDEMKQIKNSPRPIMFGRQPFRSAISCVFESAKNSLNFFESTYWSKLFMKKFITTIEMYDLTPRRVLNNPLFDYMDSVCSLGLDRTIVKCLLRYGSNPDHKMGGKYPVNVYFDQLLPYLTKFEVIGTYDRYNQELDTLMIICRAMSFTCLVEALRIFLKDHLLSAPLQALPISREFASRMDQMTRTPRPLVDLAAHFIWIMMRRNKRKVKKLPISEIYKALIIP